MNITELARRLKITPNELKESLPKMGFDIGLRAIQIPDEQAKKVMEVWREMKERERGLEKIRQKTIQSNEEKTLPISEKEVIIPPKIQVYHLAEKLNLPVTKIMNELVKSGTLVNVNENLDYEVAAIIVEELGFKAIKGESEEKRGQKIFLKDKLKEVLKTENRKDLKPRAPVVVVMGHVDHGKSSILDVIRETNVVAQEKGGITQHIGAYQVEKDSHLITFIDTPGHEDFKTMRAKGGEIADIAVLVIAADDGIQPQTLESIKIIQEERLPFMVAINKIDKPEANVERVKKGLAEINLMPEDWGGKTICVQMSAKTREGIDAFLENLVLITELEREKLVNNPKGEVVGVVIESRLDSGSGPVASIIIYNGTLRVGDQVIIGQSYGRIKSIKNQFGEFVNQAEASLPVQIYGLKKLPQAGDLIQVVSDNKIFRKRVKGLDTSFSVFKSETILKSKHKEKERISEGTDGEKRIKYLNLIIRADVFGSLGAINQALRKMDHPEVKIKILKMGLGNLTEADVDLAKASQGWLISFNTGINNAAKQLAEELGLRVSNYQVIYDLIEEVKIGMNNLLPPEIFEQMVGKAEVLKVFQQGGQSVILGAKVIKGRVIKNGIVRVWRLLPRGSGDEGMEIKGEGKIIQLQINKKEVNEAGMGVECGIKFSGKVKIEEGNILEIYQEVEKERTI